jgi:hypothetical protein
MAPKMPPNSPGPSGSSNPKKPPIWIPGIRQVQQKAQQKATEAANTQLPEALSGCATGTSTPAATEAVTSLSAATEARGRIPEFLDKTGQYIMENPAPVIGATGVAAGGTHALWVSAKDKNLANANNAITMAKNLGEGVLETGNVESGLQVLQSNNAPVYAYEMFRVGAEIPEGGLTFKQDESVLAQAKLSTMGENTIRCTINEDAMGRYYSNRTGKASASVSKSARVSSFQDTGSGTDLSQDSFPPKEGRSGSEFSQQQSSIFPAPSNEAQSSSPGSGGLEFALDGGRPMTVYSQSVSPSPRHYEIRPNWSPPILLQLLLPGFIWGMAAFGFLLSIQHAIREGKKSDK